MNNPHHHNQNGRYSSPTAQKHLYRAWDDDEAPVKVITKKLETPAAEYVDVVVAKNNNNAIASKTTSNNNNIVPKNNDRVYCMVPFIWNEAIYSAIMDTWGKRCDVINFLADSIVGGKLKGDKISDDPEM